MADTFGSGTEAEKERSNFRIGALLVEPDQNCISDGADRHRLEPKVMEVLCALAGRPGEVISRQELIDQVWGVEHGADESLTRAVSLLRSVLNTDKGLHSVIETIPKRGYRLAAEVGNVVEGTAAPEAPAMTAAAEEPVPPFVREPWRRAAEISPVRYVSALVVLAVIMLWTGVMIGRSSGSAVAVPDKSIAVLPFENLSVNAEQDYFSRGLSEEIRTLLTQLDDLKVAGRAPPSLGVEEGLDAQALGEKLRVSRVLTGSIRSDNDRIRVSAELIDTESGYQVWSHGYDRLLSAQSLFDLQKDIATDVAGALSISLNVQEPNQILGSDTDNLEAYDYFLSAREADVFGMGDRREVLALLNKALELDPDYGAARVALAMNIGAQAWNASMPVEAAAFLAEGKALAEEAVRLNPDLAQAYTALASFQALDGNWLEAGRDNKVALDRSPNLRVLHDQTIFLMRAGRIEEALSIAQRGQSADPLNPDRAATLAMAYALLGRHEAAAASLEHYWTLQLPPGGWDAYAWAIEMQAPQTLEGLTELSGRLIRTDPSLQTLVAPVLAALPDQAAALQVVEAQFEAGAGSHPNRFEILAVLAAQLGDPELALRIWRHELSGTRLRLMRIWGPVYADMRRLPAYADLMTGTGLPPYWREFGWPDRCRPVDAQRFECF
jgi:TolB-like protein/DNA-binding winged helix-turn-helix (wHTH) protein